jgi:hypothetical protein
MNEFSSHERDRTEIGLRATVTVEVAANIALLPAAIACLVTAARAKQHDPLRTVPTKLDAFRRWPGVPPPPPMEGLPPQSYGPVSPG